MASTKTTKRARRTATARGKVRFGAERSDLQSLVSEAARNYQEDLAAADAAARSGAHFARAARPHIKEIYDTAASSLAGTRQDVANAGGPVTAIGRSVLAREQAGAKNRLAAARTRAEQGLEDRIQAAAAGGVYAQQAARDQYRKTISDLQSKLTDLNDREGAFVVSEMGNILEKSAQRSATSRNIRLQDRLTTQRQAGKTITEGAFAGYTQAEVNAMSTDQRRKIAARYKKQNDGGGGGGFKAASHEDLQQFETALAKASQAINTLRTKGVPRKGDKSAKPKLTKITDRHGLAAALAPEVSDQIALSVALDMAFDGHVSRMNAKRMKAQRGVRVADMGGLTSYSDWIKRHGGNIPRGTSVNPGRNPYGTP